MAHAMCGCAQDVPVVAFCKRRNSRLGQIGVRGSECKCKCNRRLMRNLMQVASGMHVAMSPFKRTDGASPRAPTPENIMSNASKRAEGAAEELGGKIKGTVGKMIGNEQMEAEGKARELEGKAKQEAAKAAERTKGALEEVVGSVKNKVGAVIGNEQMQAEGAVKETTGEA